jgi:hypothetical protein
LYDPVATSVAHSAPAASHPPLSTWPISALDLLDPAGHPRDSLPCITFLNISCFTPKSALCSTARENGRWRSSRMHRIYSEPQCRHSTTG